MITLYILASWTSGIIIGTIGRDLYNALRSWRRSKLALQRLRKSAPTVTVNDCVSWKPLPSQDFQGYSE